MALTQAQIRDKLKTASFGLKVYAFDTIDSTNNCAKALANVGAEEGVVVFSEHQSAGRGRFNRSWESEREKNLTFSVVLRPAWCARVSLLPFLVACAIAKAVEEVTGLPVISKWPNDLLCNGKKFCGILLEITGNADGVEFVVAGIGINVNQSAFSQELASRATSLKNVAAKEIDRISLLQECLRQLERYYTGAQKRGFSKVMREWNARCMMFGRTISVEQNGSIIKGTAQKVDADGALVIQSENQTIRVLAGDVSVLE